MQKTVTIIRGTDIEALLEPLLKNRVRIIAIPTYRKDPTNRAGEGDFENRWGYLREKPPTIKQIKEWFDEEAHAHTSYAIITGGETGLYVLDFDEEEAYKEFRAENTWYRGIVVKTPKGYHAYFKGVRAYKSARLARKVELKAAANYVIGAGSNWVKSVPEEASIEVVRYEMIEEERLLELTENMLEHLIVYFEGREEREQYKRYKKQGMTDKQIKEVKEKEERRRKREATIEKWEQEQIANIEVEDTQEEILRKAVQRYKRLKHVEQSRNRALYRVAKELFKTGKVIKPQIKETMARVHALEEPLEGGRPETYNQRYKEAQTTIESAWKAAKGESRKTNSNKGGTEQLSAHGVVQTFFNEGERKDQRAEQKEAIPNELREKIMEETGGTNAGRVLEILKREGIREGQWITTEQAIEVVKRYKISEKAVREALKTRIKEKEGKENEEEEIFKKRTYEQVKKEAQQKEATYSEQGKERENTFPVGNSDITSKNKVFESFVDIDFSVIDASPGRKPVFYQMPSVTSLCFFWGLNIKSADSLLDEDFTSNDAYRKALFREMVRRLRGMARRSHATHGNQYGVDRRTIIRYIKELDIVCIPVYEYMPLNSTTVVNDDLYTDVRRGDKVTPGYWLQREDGYRTPATYPIARRNLKAGGKWIAVRQLPSRLLLREDFEEMMLHKFVDENTVLWQHKGLDFDAFYWGSKLEFPGIMRTLDGLEIAVGGDVPIMAPSLKIELHSRLHFDFSSVGVAFVSKDTDAVTNTVEVDVDVAAMASSGSEKIIDFAQAKASRESIDLVDFEGDLEVENIEELRASKLISLSSVEPPPMTDDEIEVYADRAGFIEIDAVDAVDLAPRAVPDDKKDAHIIKWPRDLWVRHFENIYTLNFDELYLEEFYDFGEKRPEPYKVPSRLVEWYAPVHDPLYQYLNRHQADYLLIEEERAKIKAEGGNVEEFDRIHDELKESVLRQMFAKIRSELEGDVALEYFDAIVELTLSYLQEQVVKRRRGEQAWGVAKRPTGYDDSKINFKRSKEWYDASEMLDFGMEIQYPLMQVKGIGFGRARELFRYGIYTLEDLARIDPWELIKIPFRNKQYINVRTILYWQDHARDLARIGHPDPRGYWERQRDLLFKVRGKQIQAYRQRWIKDMTPRIHQIIQWDFDESIGDGYWTPHDLRYALIDFNDLKNREQAWYSWNNFDHIHMLGRWMYRLYRAMNDILERGTDHWFVYGIDVTDFEERMKFIEETLYRLFEWPSYRWFMNRKGCTPPEELARFVNMDEIEEWYPVKDGWSWLYDLNRKRRRLTNK